MKGKQNAEKRYLYNHAAVVYSVSWSCFTRVGDVRRRREISLGSEEALVVVVRRLKSHGGRKWKRAVCRGASLGSEELV